MTDEAISPLRRRMIEDMTMRKLAPKTQQGYIRTIKNLALFLGRSPDTASFEDVRRFQLHVAASGVGTGAVNATVAALRFFFRITLGRRDITEHTAFVHEPRKLPVVLSLDEMARLRDAAPGLKYKAALSVALWGRTARHRGGLAQGVRHRQQAHGDPGRAGQGPRGSLRHAVSASPRPVAYLVEGGSTARLAVSRA
jgi:hypothetical protein